MFYDLPAIRTKSGFIRQAADHPAHWLNHCPQTSGCRAICGLACVKTRCVCYSSTAADASSRLGRSRHMRVLQFRTPAFPALSGSDFHSQRWCFGLNVSSSDTAFLLPVTIEWMAFPRRTMNEHSHPASVRTPKLTTSAPQSKRLLIKLSTRLRSFEATPPINSSLLRSFVTLSKLVPAVPALALCSWHHSEFTGLYPKFSSRQVRDCDELCLENEQIVKSSQKHGTQPCLMRPSTALGSA